LNPASPRLTILFLFRGWHVEQHQPFMPSRQFQRFPVDLLAIRANAPPRADRVLNLSTRGALLETRAALPVGSTHTFLLIMPGVGVPSTSTSLAERESRAPVATIEAVVAWASSTQLGLSFRAAHELIDSYLRELAR
jgi:hypothetical protein